MNELALWRRSLLGLALVLCSQAVCAGAPEFFGPLRVADQFVLTVGTLAVEPLPLRLVEEGEWQGELSVSMGNTFTRSKSVQTALEARTERLPVTLTFLDQVRQDSEVGEPLFFVDGETLRTELRLRRGLSNGLELEVRLPFVKLYGGWMDTLLEGFHGAVSLDQDGRLGVPRNVQGLFLELVDSSLMLEQGASLTPADPLVAVRGGRHLAKPGRRLLWDGAVKIPIADEDRFVSSGSVDVSLQAQWSACGRRRCRFGALNLRRLGEWQILGLGARVIPGMYAGLEQRWLGASWLVQLMIAGSPLDGIRIEDLDRETWQLSAGIHKQLGDAYSLTAAVTENVAHFENGPDLTFHWALRRSF